MCALWLFQAPEKFKDFGKEEAALIAKYGEEKIMENKERMAQFMDDLIRDSF